MRTSSRLNEKEWHGKPKEGFLVEVLPRDLSLGDESQVRRNTGSGNLTRQICVRRVWN